MKVKPLLLIALCLLVGYATAEEKPKHNYSFVDVTNGLHCTLLNVGSTSFTFSVEWSLDLEIPDRWFFLHGKLDMDQVAWDFLTHLNVDPTQGRATFEIIYDHLPWSSWEESKAKLEKQAFFHLIVPDPNDPGWLPKTPEDFGEEEAPPVTTAEAEARKVEQAEPQAGSVPSCVEKLGMTNDKLETEEPVKTNHAWLYLALALCAVCAILYALRKKRP